MELRTFWKSMTVADRSSFAIRCRTSFGHLRNVVYGSRPCSESLAVSIERESGGKVRCESLCPDTDWAYVRGSVTTKRKCG